MPAIPHDHYAELGIAWWNNLSDQDRKRWMARAGDTGRVVDAWREFQRNSTTDSPSAGRDSISRTSDIKAKPKRKRTSGRAKPGAGQYRKIDVTPAEFFAAWSRKARADLVEVLIASLDADDGDADAEDGGDDEPTLGSLDGYRQTSWSAGDADDREGDPCCDDREGDELQHGGDEHDGCELDVDGEPSRGWTVDGVFGGVLAGNCDCEADGSYATPAAWARYKMAERWAINDDGRHVDSSRMIATGRRRLMNLAPGQRAAVSPRLNRTKVGL